MLSSWLFMLQSWLNGLCSFHPNSPTGSVNNSVLYLLGDLLSIINASPSVSECDYCNCVPFKLMNFLQQFANVNQVIAQMSPRKKKMFSRNVDQRVKMSFPKPCCQRHMPLPGQKCDQKSRAFPHVCVDYISRIGTLELSPKCDIMCAGRTWDLVSKDLALYPDSITYWPVIFIKSYNLSEPQFLHL